MGHDAENLGLLGLHNGPSGRKISCKWLSSSGSQFAAERIWSNMCDQLGLQIEYVHDAENVAAKLMPSVLLQLNVTIASFCRHQIWYCKVNF